MERVLSPEQLNEWFDKIAQNQDTRELLFSSAFDIMSRAVLDSHPSVNAAYQASEEDIVVSATDVNYYLTNTENF